MAIVCASGERARAARERSAGLGDRVGERVLLSLEDVAQAVAQLDRCRLSALAGEDRVARERIGGRERASALVARALVAPYAVGGQADRRPSRLPVSPPLRNEAPR